MDLKPGYKLGRYELLSAIGECGMGEVYEHKPRTASEKGDSSQRPVLPDRQI